MGYIHTVNIPNDQSYLIEPTLFAITSGTSSAYTAAISNFALVEGVVIHIQINVTNTANATLNVNNTGAKVMRYEGTTITAGELIAGRIYSFVCTSTNSTYYWDLISDLPRDDRIELVDMMEGT